MKILVDTCIWSYALRHDPNKQSRLVDLIIKELQELLKEARVVTIGPIIQEILSGVKNEFQFTKLKNVMRAFDEINITMDNYERAAELFNKCRTKGIQGSHIDFLICAISQMHQLPIFTTDKDFQRYAQCINLQFHSVRQTKE